jgi:hypothetical protein
MGAGAMFKQINGLPGPQRQLPLYDRDGKLHSRQRSAQMCRHVIRSFVVVVVPGRILRRNGCKEGFQVGADLASRILLDQKRCGGVSTKHRQQAGRDFLSVNPGANFGGDVQQAAAACVDFQGPGNIDHGLTIQ